MNNVWDNAEYVESIRKEWGDGGQVGGHHWAYLRAVAELVRTKQVLDAGCGMGHLLPILRELIPDIDYRGFDKSPHMIRLAKEFFPEDSPRFSEGDIFDMQKFLDCSTVLCLNVLIHQRDIVTPLRQLWLTTADELIITLKLSGKEGGEFLELDRNIGYTEKLPLRWEDKTYIYSMLGSLGNVASVEEFYFDERLSMFRVTRGVKKYGGYKVGWK